MTMMVRHPDWGRTLVKLDPSKPVWVLLARESVDRAKQVENQISDLRTRVGSVGGRVDRVVPENDVSAYKRTRVPLPDGTFGYRVVRPKWEKVLTALRKGGVQRAGRDGYRPGDA